jgi:hypothetical protein
MKVIFAVLLSLTALGGVFNFLKLAFTNSKAITLYIAVEGVIGMTIISYLLFIIFRYFFNFIKFFYFTPEED